MQQDPPYVKTHFPCCVPAIPSTEEMMRETQRLIASIPSDSSVEIEARFGRCDTDGFRAGVTETAFNEVHHRLNSCREFVECHDRYRSTADGASLPERDESGWYTVQVFMHKDRTKQRTIRTETVIPNTGSSQRKGLAHSVSHVCKKVLKKVNFRPSALSMVPPSSVPRTDFRLALSVEQKIPADEIDKYVETFEVHFKKRKDYTLCPTGTERPAWRFSLTQRWKGDTLSQAEEDYKNNAPIYEIELELIDPIYAVQTDPKLLAISMLMKISNIIGMVEPDLATTSFYTMDPHARK